MIRIRDYSNLKQYLPICCRRPFCPLRPVCISGRVLDRKTGDPIPGAGVSLGAHAMEILLTTGRDGSFSARLPDGGVCTSVRLSKAGYLRRSIGCYRPCGERDDFYLMRIPAG